MWDKCEAGVDKNNAWSHVKVTVRNLSHNKNARKKRVYGLREAFDVLREALWTGCGA